MTERIIDTGISSKLQVKVKSLKEKNEYLAHNYNNLEAVI